MSYTLLQSTMAMENGPFIRDFPMKPTLKSVCQPAIFDYQKVYPISLSSTPF